MSISVTPGKRWTNPQEPVLTPGLDLTGRPTATIDANSVGIRELVFNDVGTIVAGVVGVRGTFTVTPAISISAGAISNLGTMTIVGASLTPPNAFPDPEQPIGGIWFSGRVTLADTVQLSAQNVTNGSIIIPNNTTVNIIVI